jgi:hypothetical protein
MQDFNSLLPVQNSSIIPDEEQIVNSQKNFLVLTILLLDAPCSLRWGTTVCIVQRLQQDGGTDYE